MAKCLLGVANFCFNYLKHFSSNFKNSSSLLQILEPVLSTHDVNMMLLVWFAGPILGP